VNSIDDHWLAAYFCLRYVGKVQPGTRADRQSKIHAMSRDETFDLLLDNKNALPKNWQGELI
jgi:hypothetical protein